MSFWNDPISAIGAWLKALLAGWGLAPGLVTAIVYFLAALVLAAVLFGFVVFLIWYERKLVARMQDRLGPNRVGPYGLLQPIADVLKLLTKEVITPTEADKPLYNLAPILSVAGALLVWAAVPLAPTLGVDMSVGVLFIIAAGTLSTLAIILAGWSSNNKYALLGAFRTVAQLVSYEVPMVLALMVPVILARTMSVQGIVQSQTVWYLFYAPLAALIFFITSIAEIGRTPFDLLEAESEIVAGFHIEYSGMKFAMFFAGEFLHAFTVGALTALLFLGGWRGPGVETFPILGIVYFWIKAFLAYTVVAWIRFTFPRLRIDQMMDFCWKFLTPLALVLVMGTAVLDKLVAGWSPWLRAGAHLVMNVLIGWAALAWSEAQERRKPRPVVSKPRPVARPPQQPAESVEASAEAA